MNTRALMVLSAAFLAMLGVGVTFLPQELLIYAGSEPLGALVLLVQILGAMLIGFATLNWMNRSDHIGGIYRRPVSMANFAHFAIGAIALVKGAVALDFATEVTAIATVYAVFGIWFGLVLFVTPPPARS